jgi:hypothetical protein
MSFHAPSAVIPEHYALTKYGEILHSMAMYAHLSLCSDNYKLILILKLKHILKKVPGGPDYVLGEVEPSPNFAI